RDADCPLAGGGHRSRTPSCTCLPTAQGIVCSSLRNRCSRVCPSAPGRRPHQLTHVLRHREAVRGEGRRAAPHRAWGTGPDRAAVRPLCRQRYCDAVQLRLVLLESLPPAWARKEESGDAETLHALFGPIVPEKVTCSAGR